MADVYQGISDILESMGVPKQDIRPAAGLVNDLDLDSLELVEFALSLEEQFQVQVSDEAVHGGMTVGDCVVKVRELQGKA